ncbi:chloramphenicol/florfenicol resistance protein [Planoprotostelium fungivorum]|uniref:Chloramphenicol/florfenicol resistance protein n=1 Tax=Planoprotostelium fungivorum TaxID=1890364 RepID=A0A2P6MYE3_9EUKA|nr:chloramphenicol/florfenicol resistance protein [Planoprotostelium fungivorum]
MAASVSTSVKGFRQLSQIGPVSQIKPLYRSNRLEKITSILQSLNEPEYRLTQIKNAMYQTKVKRYRDITGLPQPLKEKIEEQLGENILSIKAASIQHSSQAVKMLFRLNDGQSIESVYMKFRNGKTSLCISSQVGCALKCNFCATGAVGFKRQLTPDEITDQILYFQQNGMGEALQNPKVFDALGILTDVDLFSMPHRKLSVSTVGIIPGIERLSRDYPQVNLAFSLHSPFQEQRNILVPTNKIYPLPDVMRALERHTENTHRKIFMAYLVLDGFNDTVEHADGIKNIIKEIQPSLRHLFHINLLRYNPAEGIAPEFTQTEEGNLNRFMKLLTSRGITVTARQSFGVEIDAACGQLYKVSQTKKNGHTRGRAHIGRLDH